LLELICQQANNSISKIKNIGRYLFFNIIGGGMLYYLMLAAGKKLSVTAAIRNWNTVTQLLKMYEEKAG